MNVAKNDSGKIRMDLLPAEALIELLQPAPAVVPNPIAYLLSFAAGGTTSDLVCAVKACGDLWRTLQGAAEVMENALGKYEIHDWRGGCAWSRYIAAALRHWADREMGEAADPSSGLPHIHHFAANCLILLTYKLTGTGGDDRFRYA